jgi:hypothetical protein
MHNVKPRSRSDADVHHRSRSDGSSLSPGIIIGGNGGVGIMSMDGVNGDISPLSPPTGGSIDGYPNGANGSVGMLRERRRIHRDSAPSIMLHPGKCSYPPNRSIHSMSCPLMKHCNGWCRIWYGYPASYRYS